MYSQPKYPLGIDDSTTLPYVNEGEKVLPRDVNTLIQVVLALENILGIDGQNFKKAGDVEALPDDCVGPSQIQIGAVLPTYHIYSTIPAEKIDSLPESKIVFSDGEDGETVHDHSGGMYGKQVSSNNILFYNIIPALGTSGLYIGTSDSRFTNGYFTNLDATNLSQGGVPIGSPNYGGSIPPFYVADTVNSDDATTPPFFRLYRTTTLNKVIASLDVAATSDTQIVINVRTDGELSSESIASVTILGGEYYAEGYILLTSGELEIGDIISCAITYDPTGGGGGGGEGEGLQVVLYYE